MHFDLVDRVIEVSPERIVTLKCVSGAEEYLQDHFPSFPVLPGVMMIEAMVQAARKLLEARDASLGRHVLGQVRALKYGTFVRPGDVMKVEVSLHKVGEDQVFDFRGSAEVIRGEALAASPSGDAQARSNSVSGRFSLRPVRIAAAANAT